MNVPSWSQNQVNSFFKTGKMEGTQLVPKGTNPPDAASDAASLKSSQDLFQSIKSGDGSANDEDPTPGALLFSKGRYRTEASFDGDASNGSFSYSTTDQDGNQNVNIAKFTPTTLDSVTAAKTSNGAPYYIGEHIDIEHPENNYILRSLPQSAQGS